MRQLTAGIHLKQIFEYIHCIIVKIFFFYYVQSFICACIGHYPHEFDKAKHSKSQNSDLFLKSFLFYSSFHSFESIDEFVFIGTLNIHSRLVASRQASKQASERTTDRSTDQTSQAFVHIATVYECISRVYRHALVHMFVFHFTNTFEFSNGYISIHTISFRCRHI